MKEINPCWCGNMALRAFSPDYMSCEQCNTLVSQKGLPAEKLQVNNDEQDFYGKKYWFDHQTNDFEYPDITQRARHDLTERCLHWLETMLKYKLPPAKSLELGCSHGGFVALLRQAGYDATGLEMSSWIANFAHKTFDIPILTGPLENQTISNDSLDIIALFDVLEHLPNPLATIKQCLALLKSDGILVIQMPNYIPEKTYDDMLAQNDPFLIQLKSDEHLNLFSKSSAEKFFHRLCGKDLHMAFEPAIFSQYDMFFVVSRKPLVTNSQEKINNFLNSSLNTRFIQAMLDLKNQRDTYINHYQNKAKDTEILNSLLNNPSLKQMIRSLLLYSKNLLFNRKIRT